MNFQRLGYLPLHACSPMLVDGAANRIAVDAQKRGQALDRLAATQKRHPYFGLEFVLWERAHIVRKLMFKRTPSY
jgi:hypothetical protein